MGESGSPRVSGRTRQWPSRSGLVHPLRKEWPRSLLNSEWARGAAQSSLYHSRRTFLDALAGGGAPRNCSATSKHSRQRCRAPAVKGWSVCRCHGTGGGAPGYTEETLAARREVYDLLRQCRTRLVEGQRKHGLSRHRKTFPISPSTASSTIAMPSSSETSARGSLTTTSRIADWDQVSLAAGTNGY